MEIEPCISVWNLKRRGQKSAYVPAWNNKNKTYFEWICKLKPNSRDNYFQFFWKIYKNIYTTIKKKTEW